MIFRYIHFFVRMFADWPMPYLVLAIIIWQQAYNRLGLLLFLMSFVINIFNFSLLGTLSDDKIWRDIKRYLYRYQHCIFQSYALDQYISKEALSKDHYFSQEKTLNRHWDRHRDAVLQKSFVIAIKSETFSGERPIGLKSFPSNRSMLIFSRELPTELNPVLRFKMYHEYFHASVPAQLSKRRIMLGIGPSFLLIVYLALHIEYRIDTIGILLAISSITIIGYKYYWGNEKNEESMYAELYADYMALNHLDTPDRAFLIDYKLRGAIISDDPSLSFLQNLTRKYYFQDLLNSYKQGKEPSILDIQMTKDYPLYIYIIFLLSIYLCGNLKPVNHNFLYFDAGLAIFIFTVMWLVLRNQLRLEENILKFLKIEHNQR